MTDFKIVSVKLSDIEPNPMRRLKEYPFDTAKVAALKQSIHDVGLWAGVIGRKHGTKIQIAFGHHRIEAARQELGKRAEVQIIIRNLSDQEMLEFMGRENLEDYNANFFVMLESWQAAKEFVRARALGNSKPLDVAKVLGWINPHPDGTGLQMKEVAKACDNAATLIDGGYIKRSELEGLSVRAALDICQTVVSRQQLLDTMAKETKRPAAEVEHAKKMLGKAAAFVAQDVRSGKIARRDIRGRVDVAAYQHARDAKKKTPLFDAFGRSLTASIQKMLRTDLIAEKLDEIVKAMPSIETDEDHATIRHIDFALAEHGIITEQWRKKLAPKGKVIPFHLLKKDA